MKEISLVNLLPPYEIVTLRSRAPGFSSLTVNPRYELFIVTQGSLKLTIQNKDYWLKASDMYFIPAMMRRAFYTENGFSQIAINFRVQEDERGMIDLLKYVSSIMIWHQCPLAQPTLDMIKSLKWLTPLDHLELAQRLDALVLSFLRLDKHEVSFQNKLRALLEDHLASPLSLQEIADRMSYSRAQLQRITQQQLGCSVMEFYRRIRLQKSCEWLLHFDKDAGTIAQSLGFCDQSHFQSFFKERMNMTPRQFRQMNSLT